MIADIALPIPVGKHFSYSVPDDILPYISQWSRVRVPFHQRDAVGVVADLKEGDPTGLKPVIEPLDFFPLIHEELPDLAYWASSFYLAPLGLVMKYVLPPVRDIERYLVAGEAAGHKDDVRIPLGKMIKRSGRLKLMELFRQGSLVLNEGLSLAGFSPAAPWILNKQDEMAGHTILIDSIEKRLERYISLIGPCLENNENILFLLPDHHAAGAYFSQKMKELYGDRVLWFGSGIPVRQRMETYFRARHEGGHIILGNKSLVFLPARNLSLIIAERYDDEEYRNEESFKFNAVRTAVERARLRGIPILLGGAACSLDILYHTSKNGSALHFRAADGPLNLGEIKRSRSSGELLDRLCADIEDVAGHGMNVAVYAPRKEYGSYLKCQACREDLVCEKCGSPLDYDRGENGFHCPSCDSAHPYTETCPLCGSRMIGFARIGASFIYDHISRNVPGVRATLITGDSLKKELSVLRKNTRDPQCLVGTQVLSKLYGHHYDKLFLVDWEELRKMSGFRSDEKTHQVLSNLIDALTPDEIVCYSKQKKSVDIAPYLNAAQFYATELKKRKDAEFPPFARMFTIEARAKTRGAVDRALAKVKTVISSNNLDPFVFGTVPGDRHPFHIWKTLLKGPEDLLTKSFTALYTIPGIEIDPDPPNF
jgi:primosomal protein N' (replication factor Y) (superfamily II helicase)